MPLPSPRPTEAKAEFLDRCMAHPTMNADFPTAGQRYAVCLRQWGHGMLSPADMADAPKE